MKITIELQASFGHPSNRPVPEYVFEQVAKELPKLLEKAEVPLRSFKVVSVVVD